VRGSGGRACGAGGSNNVTCRRQQQSHHHAPCPSHHRQDAGGGGGNSQQQAAAQAGLPHPQQAGVQQQQQQSSSADIAARCKPQLAYAVAAVYLLFPALDAYVGLPALVWKLLLIAGVCVCVCVCASLHRIANSCQPTVCGCAAAAAHGAAHATLLQASSHSRSFVGPTHCKRTRRAQALLRLATTFSRSSAGGMSTRMCCASWPSLWPWWLSCSGKTSWSGEPLAVCWRRCAGTTQRCCAVRAWL
jgi:hypothetical protein